MTDNKKYPILNLTKDDIIQCYKDAGESIPSKQIKNLSEDNMRYIARKLGELYCETDYWETLKSLFEGLCEN